MTALRPLSGRLRSLRYSSEKMEGTGSWNVLEWTKIDEEEGVLQTLVYYSIFVYVPSKTGDKPEKKEVLLDEEDPIWVELRDAHIADASERLHEKMTNFVPKNKAAQLKHSSKDFGDLSSKDLQKMVHALPQYSEQIDLLSLHVEIARTINRTIMEQGLRDLGQLEQDLVFGDAGRKDVIKFLSTNHIINHESKLRLMMIDADEASSSKRPVLVKLKRGNSLVFTRS